MSDSAAPPDRWTVTYRDNRGMAIEVVAASEQEGRSLAEGLSRRHGSAVVNNHAGLIVGYVGGEATPRSKTWGGTP